MPRLLLFAPCDKVIVDDTTKTLSLISVFENLDIPTPPPGESDTFLVAMQWNVVTMWYAEAGDERRRFEETCEVVMPDGLVKLTIPTEFGFEAVTMHRNVKRVLGFPGVRSGGQYWLVLYLKKLATDDGEADEERKEILRYPLTLRFTSEPK